MKLLLIRLIDDKQPVMIIGGHYNDWNECDLFWRIYECIYPNQCEYKELRINTTMFSVMWPSNCERNIDDLMDGETEENASYILGDGMRLCEEMESAISGEYDSSDGWIAIDINI